jgi:hypothetical protein
MARRETRKNYLNKTSVNFMCNSNKYTPTKADFQTWANNVIPAIDRGLFDSAGEVDKVFGRSPLVDEVILHGINAEVGKPLRAHINIGVTILHQVPKYSIKKLRERLKAWLDLNVPLERGTWNVHQRLRPMYHDNYNNKDVRWANNDQVQQDYDEDDEMQRLQIEDKTMKEVENLAGDLIRVLDLEGNPRVNRISDQPIVRVENVE